MKNPLFENSSAPVKIIFFLFIVVGSFFVFLFLGTIISIPVFNLDSSNFESYFDFFNPDNIGFIKFMQAIQHIGIYLVPPIVAAYIFSKKPKSYLAADVKSPGYLFLILALLAFFSIPLTGYFGALNTSLSLPESLSGLEQKLRLMEDNALEITQIFLNVSTTGGLLANLLIIAVLPAIGEEFFFRGILQKLFKDWTKNIHVSIFITSILFSAVHLQFFTFLPRFLMGMMFGYLLVWSKSIWMPVLAHFINNATAVFMYYFIEDAGKVEETESILSQPMALFPAFVLFSIFLYFFYKQTHKPKLTPYL